MGWDQSWDNILNNGETLWKVEDIKHKESALNTILKYHESSDQAQPSPLRIVCPLAGDDPFVWYAWSQGHSVTAIDLVPAAVASMRKRFEPQQQTSSETSSTISSTSSDDDTNSLWSKRVLSQPKEMIEWKHSSGRVTIYEGDVLAVIPELEKEQFDAIYDKDAFGALDPDVRKSYGERIAAYTKPGAVFYTEVKYKEEGEGRGAGPPYHIEKDDLVSALSNAFDYIASLGEVYDLGRGPTMKQTGHILKRK